MAVTLNMAGFGLCAKSSVDELLNFTVHRVRANVTQSKTELQVCEPAFGIKGPCTGWG